MTEGDNWGGGVYFVEGGVLLLDNQDNAGFLRVDVGICLLETFICFVLGGAWCSVQPDDTLVSKKTTFSLPTDCTVYTAFAINLYRCSGKPDMFSYAGGTRVSLLKWYRSPACQDKYILKYIHIIIVYHHECIHSFGGRWRLKKVFSSKSYVTELYWRA